MQRISTLSRLLNKFGVGKDGFKDGDLANGITATNLNADWCNGLQEEVISVIEQAGLTPSNATLNQLMTAIATLQRQQTNTAYTTAGTAPAFTVTLPASAVALAALGTNLRLRLKFHAAGAGSDTLNIAGLGAKSLKQYDASGTKISASIAANQLADIEYDGIDFVILDPLPVSGLQAGELAFFARNTAPSGYLKANGALVSRATYSTLFTAIGTTFGVGDGSTTFNLPDLRGEFLRGWDDSRGVDSSRVFGSAQSDAFQGHYHYNGYTNAKLYAGGSTTGDFLATGPSVASDGVRNPTTDGTNGAPRTAAETRPRNVALLACIKY